MRGGRQPRLRPPARPKEKLGIVGRTGAGKSSIASALLRLYELESGAIRIDGIDISCVALETLRSRLGMITQDAVLFRGTLRYNVDPFEAKSDEQVWDALRAVQLVEMAEKGGGLEMTVDERGNNLSQGERQLVCIARALLRNARVLIQDEATANIDTATDAIIQQVLRTSDAFVNATTISIAHRLHTIIDSDRCLVLDRGCVVEHDAPAALAKRAQSRFKDLLQDSGSSRHLTVLATQASLANDAKRGEGGKRGWGQRIDCCTVIADRSLYDAIEGEWDLLGVDLVDP